MIFWYNYRLFITSIILAIKFHDDIFFKNSFYSKVAGVSCSEINELEMELLGMIDYALCVEEAEFAKYKRRIELMYSDMKPEETKCELALPYKPDSRSEERRVGKGC